MTVIPLKIGNASVTAEVAETPFRLALGLMFRRRLDPEGGMLLNFGKSANHAIHMWFVRFPLDVVFIDSDGVIARIHHARPWEFPFTAGTAVRYVLEVNAGFCLKNGITDGDRCANLPV
jgi:uncharacterized membrane protein (UPF0127 family)